MEIPTEISMSIIEPLTRGQRRGEILAPNSPQSAIPQGFEVNDILWVRMDTSEIVTVK